MNRLKIDDPLWAELDTRSGKAGWVPAVLVHLLEHPDDRGAFSDLWPELSSEGSSYSAGHAVMPYVLDVAERLPAGHRLEHLAFIALLIAGTDPSLRPELRDAYKACFSRALRVLAEGLPFPHSAAETRHLLAAAAALKGYPKIADVMGSLDCLAQCPCGLADAGVIRAPSKPGIVAQNLGRV